MVSGLMMFALYQQMLQDDCFSWAFADISLTYVQNLRFL